MLLLEEPLSGDTGTYVFAGKFPESSLGSPDQRVKMTIH